MFTCSPGKPKVGQSCFKLKEELHSSVLSKAFPWPAVLANQILFHCSPKFELPHLLWSSCF